MNTKNQPLMTLIIPTFNRPAFLARLLSCFLKKKINFLFWIPVMKNAALNQQASTVLGEQVRYVSFPSTMPVATKLLEGLKLVILLSVLFVLMMIWYLLKD